MGLTAPLRQRNFRLLWTGMAVSLLGDGVFIVAVAWQAYALVDRVSTLAYIGLAASLPQVILLPVGGAVCDRISRQSVLFWADVARAIAVAVVATLAVVGELHLLELYVASAVIGIATAFASPALDALVPQLVTADELTQANAIDQFVRPVSIQLAGPALGGIAVAVVHPAGAFCIDALTFAFSALCVTHMTRVRQKVGRTRNPLGHDVLEGLRYVRRHVWLWGTFLSATFTYLLFIGPTQVLLPYIVRNSLHQGASTYGEILAVGGVGALAGALLMSRAREPRRPLTWIYLWWAVATLAVAGYGVATGAWGLALAALVVNGAEAVGAVVWATVKQRHVENSMLGRVSSIDWCVSTALLPLSYAITAPIAHALGARTTLVLAGTLGAIVTLGFLFLPGMRLETDVAMSSPDRSDHAKRGRATLPRGARLVMPRALSTSRHARHARHKIMPRPRVDAVPSAAATTLSAPVSAVAPTPPRAPTVAAAPTAPDETRDWAEEAAQAMARARSADTPDAWHEAARIADVVLDLTRTMHVAADTNRRAQEKADAALRAAEEAHVTAQRAAGASVRAQAQADAALRAAEEARITAEAAAEAAAGANRRARDLEEAVAAALVANTPETWNQAYQLAAAS